MCTIRDIVEVRAVNPPVSLWSVRKGYSLFWDEEHRLRATFSDDPAEGVEIQHRTNVMLIDALEAGEKLQNGESAEAVVSAWIEKYGFSPTINDTGAFSGSSPNGILNCITLVYTYFCMFVKARYGYDLFKHKEVENASAAHCAKEFRLSTITRSRIVFDGCTIKTEYDASSLTETLLSLLADFVTTDNGWQQFTCRMCGKISIRRNPKKCYCNECSSKRYQVSRQKKRMEGGNAHGNS